MGDEGVWDSGDGLPSEVSPVRFESDASSALRSARIWLNSKSACSSGVKVFDGAFCFGGSMGIVEEISLGISLETSLGLDPHSQAILVCEWKELVDLSRHLEIARLSFRGNQDVM